MTDSTGRLLAFVEQVGSLPKRGPEGPILYWEGEAFDEEISNGGRLIEDHNFPEPPGHLLTRPQTPDHGGLMLFEGFIEVQGADEPDVYFRGEWRRLTHWEMLQVREGRAPWSKPCLSGFLPKQKCKKNE